MLAMFSISVTERVSSALYKYMLFGSKYPIKTCNTLKCRSLYTSVNTSVSAYTNYMFMHNLIQIMKIDNYQGDLTNISATTKPLVTDSGSVGDSPTVSLHSNLNQTHLGYFDPVNIHYNSLFYI